MKKALQKNHPYFFLCMTLIGGALILFFTNNMNFLIPFIISMFSIALGFNVYLSFPQSKLNQAFLFLTFSMSIWAMASTLVWLSDEIKTSMFFIKLSYFTGLVLAYAFFLFAEYFPDSIRVGKNEILKFLLLLLLPLFLLLIFFTDFIVFDLVVLQGIRRIIVGKGYLLYVSCFFSQIVYGLVLLWKKMKRLKGLNYFQTKYLFLGSIIASSMGLIMNIIMPMFVAIKYSLFGRAYAIFFFVLFLTYSGIKFRFMDIKIIITRSFLYSIFTAIFTAIYLAFILIIGNYFSWNMNQGISSLMIVFYLFFLFSLSFQPFKNILEAQIEKIFFKDKHLFRKKINEMIDQTLTIVDFEVLIDFIGKSIRDISDASYVQIFIKKNNSSSYENCFFLAIDKKAPFSISDDLLNLMKQKSGFIIDGDSQNVEFSRVAKELEAALIIPLLYKEVLLGGILLGTGIKEIIYASEELNLLNLFVKQASTALENTLLIRDQLNTQKELMRTDKLKSLGTIAAGMAHEIKNPLTVISGLAKSVKERYQEKDDEFFNDFDNVVPRQLDRIRKIAEELSQYGKQPKNEKKPVDLNKVLEEVLAFFAGQCKEKNIRIEKKLGFIGTISADAEQIAQVFTNLILNAIEAMASTSSAQGIKKGVHVIARSGATQQSLLTIESRIADKSIEITILDTGEGIDEDNLVDIFEPFYTTKENGAGLGLAIVKKIVAEHNGQIRVFSQKNKGTTFVLTFTFTV